MALRTTLGGLNATVFPEEGAGKTLDGGVSKAKFEAYALAASIIGKCHFCVKSHYELLKKEGWTTQQLRDVGRIAAVVNATAQVLSAQG